MENANINNFGNSTTIIPSEIPSNNTLYVNRINEKIKLDGKLIPVIVILKLDLKQFLFQMFSVYGEIVEIQARKSLAMKGQAFVVFKNQEDAVNAKQALNGYTLIGKPIVY